MSSIMVAIVSVGLEDLGPIRANFENLAIQLEPGGWGVEGCVLGSWLRAKGFEARGLRKRDSEGK